MDATAGSNDYCMRIVSDLSEVGAERWNELVAHGDEGTPFLRYEFLHTLHTTGCASRATGWEPHYLTLWTHDSAKLVAAVPLYRKHHSYGEYVFDWAWADAHQRHGIAYYPKWLVAVPFTPVQGTRLLAIDEPARQRAAESLVAYARSSNLSSLHVLLETPVDTALLEEHGLLTRHSVQFRWFNRGAVNFEAYLGSLTQPKRKKIRAERRKVAEAGVSFVRKIGTAIEEDDLRFFSRCYARTYAAHHSTPYLNLKFFVELVRTMPQHIVLVIALREGQPIASSLALFDEQRLYGRYWGAIEHVPCLHFETSYYQMIEFAIERGLQVFEGGAQGEHKHSRGFEPVVTLSSHALMQPAFAAAIERYLENEAGGIEAYVDELAERSALKSSRDD